MLNFGIIGCGGIAQRMADTLKISTGARLYAAASRTRVKAEEFCEKNGVSVAYFSYDEICKDENIDVIYIATTHQNHKEAALLAIRNGKHVLIEKPMVVNSAEIDEIMKAAKGKNVFCMEAMWTRFLPIYDKIKAIIASGKIGEIVNISAEFCVKVDPDDMSSRLCNPEVAGGALLDLGVYPLNFAAMFLGSTPVKTVGVAAMSKANVDMNASISLLYENGATASIQTGLKYNSTVGVINCTNGKIEVPEYIWGNTANVYMDGKIVETITAPFEDGFLFEVTEICKCITANKLESDIMPLSETANITKMMDELRCSWNFKYPFE